MEKYVKSMVSKLLDVDQVMVLQMTQKRDIKHTSLVLGLNQCEMSFPAAARMGFSSTSPVHSDKR